MRSRLPDPVDRIAAARASARARGLHGAVRAARPASRTSARARAVHRAPKLALGAARAWTAIALVGAALAAARPLPAQDIGLPLGTMPEAVTIEDLDGAPVDLGEYVGKTPVLIEFWATWCPLCRALEPRIEEVRNRFGERVDVLIVAVAVNQTKRSIQRHLEDHPLPGRVLWDTDGRAVRAFKAPSTSYIVVLDAAGRVVYTGLGEDQELVAAAEKALDAAG